MVLPERDFEVNEMEKIYDRVFGERSDVPASFALIDTTEPYVEGGVEEFTSHRLDAHLIIFDVNGNIANDHAALQERRLHLSASFQLGEKIVLLIPEGTRNLKSVLPLIARNIPNYGGIFDQVGQMLHDLEEANLGLPIDDRLLTQFAWAPAAEDSERDGGLIMVPPYDLARHPGLTVERLKEVLHIELVESRLFSDQQTRELMRRVDDGQRRIG